MGKISKDFAKIFAIIIYYLFFACFLIMYFAIVFSIVEPTVSRLFDFVFIGILFIIVDRSIDKVMKD